MKDTRSRFQIRSTKAKRMVLWYVLKQKLDLILISEFPKSGGTWFCQMLSDLTKVPFPRNVSPKFEKSIMHGHYPYNSRFGKMIYVLRDGRDVMISAYYHFLFENDKNPTFLHELHRSRLPLEDYSDIQKNMPAFIEYMFTKFAHGKLHFNWSEGVNMYYGNKNIHIVKYEDMLKDANKVLREAAAFLGEHEHNEKIIQDIVDKYSFKNLTKRNPGEENKKSFIRKGIAGDWKNHFTKEASEVFNYYAGEELIKSGYESNKDWY